MSNYVKAVDYSAKDALATGNPNKIIKGAELNDEFNAIATAIGTKADLASPTFLGNPSATTQPLGNNSTRLATTAFVQSELNDLQANVAITGGTIDDVDITGGSISGLDTPLEVASGGTGASSFTLNSVVLGNNTNALNGNMVAPGSSGNVLTSNGTTWVSQAVPTPVGVAQSRNFGTTYTADTAGIIIGNANNNFSVNSGFTITVAGNVLVNSRTSSEGANGFVSGTAAVGKGQSWSANISGGASAISLWFIPLGS